MKYVRTFRKMLTNPEIVIDPFVLEENSNFQHPFVYGLIGALIVIAFSSLVLGIRTPMPDGFVSQEISQYEQLTYWIEYANLRVSTLFLPLIMLLLLTPSLTLPGLFFFRNKIDGFYYNLVLSTYAVGTSILALLVLVPIWFVMPSTLFNESATTYLPLVVVGIVILRIYERYLLISGLRIWIQIFSNYLLGCLLFLVLKSFSVSVIGYFIFAIYRFIEIWKSL